MTDRELIGLLRSDPEKGLAAVVGQYTGYVLKLAYIRLGSVCTQEDIEEAVSDIFLAFYDLGRRNGFAFPSVRAALSVIGGRHCINIFNKLSKRPQHISIDEIFVTAADEKSPDDTSRTLTDAVRRLGSPDTEIFVRRYFLGQKTAEIAQELGMKPNTIDKRISRGLVRLKKILEEESES